MLLTRGNYKIYFTILKLTNELKDFQLCSVKKKKNCIINKYKYRHEMFGSQSNKRWIHCNNLSVPH